MGNNPQGTYRVEQSATFDLATAALAKTTSTSGRGWYLDSVEIHATGSLDTQTMTITRDDEDGAAYDAQIYTSGTIGTVTSVVYFPTGRIYVEPGSELVVGLTHTSTPAVTGTVKIKGYETRIG